jgi:hypothetical protein
MALTRLTWHTVAQLGMLVSALACSGSEESADGTETVQRDADTTEHSDDGDPLDRAPVQPQATVIRLINGSSETRSRLSPCSGPRDILVRPAAIGSEPPVPTCSQVDCADTSEDEVLAPATECSALACAPGRVDLVPGAADADYEWDGVYWALTERNCYDATTPESGAPMLARVCFGRPAAGDYDLQDVTCTDFPFVYGVPVVEVELQ